MSTTRRAYNILRGWIGTEWDRIREIEHDLAESELRESQEPGAGRSARSDFEPTPATPEDSRAHACRLLGVSETAEFEEIRKAFDRLNKRSDPEKFPANSPEREQAAQIQKRIHWAYHLLTDSLDTVEKRFRSLEI